MNELIYALIAVFTISVISLIGIFTISIKKELFNKIISALVAFATGSFLGAAFFNILPEAIEKEKKRNDLCARWYNVIFCFVIIY